MNIIISNEQSKMEFNSEHEKLIRAAINEVISEMPFSADFEVSVVMTDDEGIHSINLEHRGIDSATDVLSFPMLEYEKEGILAEKVFENEICPLGDIVISAETAMRQAKEYGHSLEREISFLTVHSMLHLFGYDHEDEEDRIIMRQKEEYILKKIGLVR